MAQVLKRWMGGQGPGKVERFDVEKKWLRLAALTATKGAKGEKVRTRFGH